MNEEIIVLKKQVDYGRGELGEEEYIGFFSNLSDPVDAGLKHVEEENEEDRDEAKWEIQRMDRDNGIFHAERHYDDWPYYIEILSTEAVSKDEIGKGIDVYKDYDYDPRDNPRYYVGNEEERSDRIRDYESTPTSEGFGRRHSTKHAALENLKSLIKLANHLDGKGLVKEADYLDRIIKEGGFLDYYREQDAKHKAWKARRIAGINETKDWFAKNLYHSRSDGKSNFPVTTDKLLPVGDDRAGFLRTPIGITIPAGTTFNSLTEKVKVNTHDRKMWSGEPIKGTKMLNIEELEKIADKTLKNLS